MSTPSWRAAQAYRINHTLIAQACEKLPRPCIAEIALYTGLTESTVERHLADEARQEPAA
ncbi:hypothetical protein ATK17_3968 [Branchiibius hedensis]|uniref:Uncharacterized protein n=1 Tax=Branchiibius hedensis TaxID=672460 RepID=A0A2Y9BN06_9MICO|nr:hypothetical protein [Branchiibius hedensis]PWJ22799.1 hypothetical protein ATK17_3968 [Branchiibius hedensis]SSA59148.1 hypothetical protein SAMN04489750_3968 [Branchiibius hedensis]